MDECLSTYLEFPKALPGIPNCTALGVKNADIEGSLKIWGEIWQHTASSPEAIINPLVKKLVEELNCELPLSGQISKFSDLTLDQEAKMKANIPANADKFCWGNPLALGDENKKSISKLDPATLQCPEVYFLLYGGFMYFSGENLIQCNCLVPSNEGLFFSAPSRMLSHSLRDIQTDLARSGRFQEITIDFFKERGANFFCWILPGEFELCENGGFIYLFGKQISHRNPKDCYFGVLGKEQYQERLAAVQTEINRGKLKDPTFNQFFLAGMDKEEIRAFLAGRKEKLNQLLDEREEQEITPEEIKKWSTQDCISSLTQAGANQQVIQLVQEKELTGQNFLCLGENFALLKRGSADINLTENLNARIEKLQMELDSLQVCSVCVEALRQAMFLPCGHVPSCMKCCENLAVCPLCRKIKLNVQKVHL